MDRKAEQDFAEFILRSFTYLRRWAHLYRREIRFHDFEQTVILTADEEVYTYRGKRDEAISILKAKRIVEIDRPESRVYALAQTFRIEPGFNSPVALIDRNALLKLIAVDQKKYPNAYLPQEDLSESDIEPFDPDG